MSDEEIPGYPLRWPAGWKRTPDYRRLARRAHPDSGGSHDEMVRLNVAREAALAAVIAGGGWAR